MTRGRVDRVHSGGTPVDDCGRSPVSDEAYADGGSPKLEHSDGDAGVDGDSGGSQGAWSLAATRKYANILSEGRKKDMSRIDDYVKAFTEIDESVVEEMKSIRMETPYVSPYPLMPILANHWGVDQFSKEMAKKFDSLDKLKGFRKLYIVPKKKDCIRVDKTNVGPNDEVVYLCSNLLGLKPKTVDGYMNELLRDWGNWGVWQNFEGRFAGLHVDQKPTKGLEKVVGARNGEVTLMNGCTVNLHFMLIHFYQPTETRYKIICEENPFSSDIYCFKSQLRMHGIDPAEGLIYVRAREGERYLRHEDVLDAIEKHGQQTALVCFGGVHFLTGQRFDMEDITRAAHEQGCVCGFDLAHAVGNCELHLHRWNVDFAVWCSYKYCSGGQGAIGGCFVHKNHWDRSAPRLEGWWGTKEDRRFVPSIELDPALGANAFRISMASMWNTVPLYAAMEIYDKTCMRAMDRRRFWFNGFFDTLLDKLNSDLREKFGDNTGLLAIPDPNVFKIVTPRDPDERANQVTLIMRMPRPDVIYAQLTKAGFVMDYKKPNLFRISPHQLYTTFTELFLLVDFLRKTSFEHFSKMAASYRDGMATA